MQPNFFNLKELNKLHIELSNLCNAACPMCPRFHQGSPIVRPDMELEQITLDKFKQYFSVEVVAQCTVFEFCGTHGDPATARDLIEICEYIESNNPNAVVRMNTNGGIRNTEFWNKLGTIFARHKKENTAHWHMIFSIDGLEDTNHLYRRNVNWSKLMDNVAAFIDAGGVAEWDYLIFKHNEHQLEQAEALSKEIGFKFFTPKKALGVDNGSNLTKLPALTKEGVLDYYIEAPVNPDNRNLRNPIGDTEEKHYPFDPTQVKSGNERTVVFFKKKVVGAYERINEIDPLDTVDISCKSKKWFGGKEVFVDCHGRVFPCCFIGTYLNASYTDVESLQLHNEINKYGWDKFNLNKHSLEDILNQEHLDNLYADSWSKPSIKEGKLAYCAKMCGSASKLDRIYTHDKMTDKGRLERNLQNVCSKD